MDDHDTTSDDQLHGATGWLRDQQALTDGGGRVVDLPLARRLRAAGLPWTPGHGDRFVVPDRGMDDVVFLVAPMVVEVVTRAGQRLLAFNGTTEWALDHVLPSDVVWLPGETDLRTALGLDFVGLWQQSGRWLVEHTLDGATTTVESDTPLGALGEAALAALTSH